MDLWRVTHSFLTPIYHKQPQNEGAHCQHRNRLSSEEEKNPPPAEARAKDFIDMAVPGVLRFFPEDESGKLVYNLSGIFPVLYRLFTVIHADCPGNNTVSILRTLPTPVFCLLRPAAQNRFCAGPASPAK